jgi:DNA-directed RNA polymerase subunit H
LGDVEMRALAEEFPTFSVVVAPGFSVVFHTAHNTVKKQEVFHAAETGAPAGVTPHVILVLRNKNTATMKSLMSEASARRVRMEIFSIQELQYNPARHALVPRHTKVPKASEERIMRTYSVSNRFQLPLILQGDVMARYLGLGHGDVVRIERPSPTAGIAVVYRVCM